MGFPILQRLKQTFFYSDFKTMIGDIKLFILTMFDRDITVYASSLSFYTIFTVVPLLIISLSLIANVPIFMEQYSQIQQFIFENLLPGQATSAMANYLDSFFKNSIRLGMIGFITMIVSSLLFFQNFEHIVGKIFHSPKRKLLDAITTYWTLITLTPIVLIGSMSLKAYLEATITGFALNALSIFPFLLLWGIFFLIYKIAVNANVAPRAAAISSFVVALVWGLAKNSFVHYVFYNKTYATMYGSLSALIFFFLWIYVSWIIVIYGMKLCYLIHGVYQRQPAHHPTKPHSPSPSNSQEGEKNA